MMCGEYGRPLHFGHSQDAHFGRHGSAQGARHQETATAHRFRVMLPVKPGSSGNDDDSRTRLEVARRVIELHKPAHTSFELRFYWAMFRLGEARLGSDTLIDQGSRDPRLMPPIVLGQGHLLEGYLAPRHPYNIPDRQVLGRNQLGS